MSKEDDYRKNAAEIIDLAQHANSSRDKSRLLALRGGSGNLNRTISGVSA
jgi:hypothetical protein